MPDLISLMLSLLPKVDDKIDEKIDKYFSENIIVKDIEILKTK